MPLKRRRGQLLTSSPSVNREDMHMTQNDQGMYKHPRVEIQYCTQCRWLLRAAWMAQELLTTFAAELGEVAIQPGIGGVFEVRVDGETIWSRATQKRFPDVRELKQLVRDRVAPGRDLGHTDRRPQ